MTRLSYLAIFNVGLLVGDCAHSLEAM